MSLTPGKIRANALELAESFQEQAGRSQCNPGACPKDDVGLCRNRTNSGPLSSTSCFQERLPEDNHAVCQVNSYCRVCRNLFRPEGFREQYKHLFRHGLQVWAVYQRVVLRLPYAIIAQVMEHLFGVGVGIMSIIGFLGTPVTTGKGPALLRAIG